jgi:hypothetical protein
MEGIMDADGVDVKASGSTAANADVSTSPSRISLTLHPGYAGRPHR